MVVVVVVVAVAVAVAVAIAVAAAADNPAAAYADNPEPAHAPVAPMNAGKYRRHLPRGRRRPSHAPGESQAPPAS